MQGVGSKIQYESRRFSVGNRNFFSYHVRLPKGKMEALHPCSQSAGWKMTPSKVFFIFNDDWRKGKRGREEILNLQIIVSVELEDAVCFHH